MSTNSKELAKKTLRLLDLGSVSRNKYVNLSPDADATAKGLSSRQLEILFRMYLLEQNNVTVLAESMELSKSTVSILINKLIKKGFVIRKYPEEDDDKRKIYFYVSDKGNEFLNSMSSSKITEFTNIYGKMDTPRKLSFDKASDILSEFLDEDTLRFHDAVNKLLGSHADNFKNTKTINMLMVLSKILKPTFKKLTDNDKIVNEITEKQFKILVAIHQLGKNTVTKLENFFSTSGSSVSIIVLKLEKAGYILKERNKCEEDHRITYLSLTDKGIEVLSLFSEIVIQSLTEDFNKYTDEEKEKINDAFDKLIFAIS